MATQQSTVDFILENIAGGGVSARKMFGEYAIYCDGKLVALVCDDRLFMKPTQAGRAHIGEVVEAPPYPSAKPCLVVEGDRWDDSDWMTALFRVTAFELPAPSAKPMKKRGKIEPPLVEAVPAKRSARSSSSKTKPAAKRNRTDPRR